MRSIKMVDLHSQYLQIKKEVDRAIQKVLDSTDFIQGQAVKDFENNLSSYMGGAHVISCGNGTDALQIAMMALDFKPGDEVILPAHTYVAVAEVIALLNLVPVFADVDPNSFTLDVTKAEGLITKRTVAIVPVHLYGQCADMNPILKLAEKFNLHIIEDAAQSLGSDYFFSDGQKKKAGTLGKVGTTSFFPSKNLGAFGDGGAIFTHDPGLAEKIRMIANHGQRKKYHHDLVGVNSRLDTIQAAILNVKLLYLDEYTQKRKAVADFYDSGLKGLPFLKIPLRVAYSSHIFHQYTIVTQGINRDELKDHLEKKHIPTMIYYPIPLHFQNAYRRVGSGPFEITEKLSETVLSLPIHTEMDEDQLSYICESIKSFVRS